MNDFKKTFLAEVEKTLDDPNKVREISKTLGSEVLELYDRSIGKPLPQPKRLMNEDERIYFLIVNKIKDMCQRRGCEPLDLVTADEQEYLLVQEYRKTVTATVERYKKEMFDKLTSKFTQQSTSLDDVLKDINEMVAEEPPKLEPTKKSKSIFSKKK